MEQTVTDSDFKELQEVLANPADKTIHTGVIKMLAGKYPQSNLLHVLSARAGNKDLIKKAAIYFDNSALYHFVKASEQAPSAAADRLIDLDGPGIGPLQTFDDNQTHFNDAQQPDAETKDPEYFDNEPPEIVNPLQPDVENKPEGLIMEQNDWFQNDSTEKVIENKPVEPEISVSEPQLVAKAEDTPLEEDAKPNEANDEESFDWKSLSYEDGGNGIANNAHAEANTDHDEEVFEEITGIDDFFLHTTVPKTEKAETKPEEHKAKPAEDLPPLPSESKPDNNFAEPLYHPFIEESQEEMLERENNPTENSTEDIHSASTLNEDIVSSIVATDFFGFEKSLSKEQHTPPKPGINQEPVKLNNPHQNEEVQEKQTVAKYHDDSLPYSFLWWLDKTRREHIVYQPYAKAPALPNLSTITEQKPVQQQPLFEHKKEDIIERFIQEEPHIKPPSSDKLDNENKARTSAEDSDEMVTETLAKIYIDQMLFHKAVVTYKKLMLRFPEKSSYFAGQIQLLENRIK